MILPVHKRAFSFSMVAHIVSGNVRTGTYHIFSSMFRCRAMFVQAHTIFQFHVSLSCYIMPSFIFPVFTIILCSRLLLFLWQMFEPVSTLPVPYGPFIGEILNSQWLPQDIFYCARLQIISSTLISHLSLFPHIMWFIQCIKFSSLDH